MERPRVLLADDHRMLREAFAQLLEPSCEIVGAVGDGRALLTAAARAQAGYRRRRYRNALAQWAGRRPAAQANDAGAQDHHLDDQRRSGPGGRGLSGGRSSYLLKNSAASELLRAVDEAMRGQSYVTPLVAKGLVDSLAHPATRQTRRM